MNLKSAVDLCKRFEGLYLTPYLCPAGVATIGYGTTRYPGGLAVTMADSAITQAQAEAYLLNDLQKIRLPVVLKALPNVTNSEHLCAAIDFAYNLGNGNFLSSTFRKKLNAGDLEGAKLELAKWNKAGGKVLAGLTKRRAAEAALLV